MHYWNFWSSEKSQKIRSSENETFDQVKNYNFDWVKFDLLNPSPKSFFLNRNWNARYLQNCCERGEQMSETNSFWENVFCLSQQGRPKTGSHSQVVQATIVSAVRRQKQNLHILKIITFAQKLNFKNSNVTIRLKTSTKYT